MIEVPIPGKQNLILDHLVCDVNGTLALDGRLIPGIAERITALRTKLDVHLITANTHGRQEEMDALLGIRAILLKPGNEVEQKAEFIRQLGAERTAAIGQGANDQKMLKEAILGICILSPEGSFIPTLQAADMLLPDILSALDLFSHPTRITATLRQ
jgi:P-type E1-E2 ATPase